MRDAVILWDVMGTLVTEPFFEAVPAFFGLTLDELLAAKHPTAWIDFEHGRIDEATFLSRFFLDGRPVDGVGLKQAMQQAYDYMDGVEPLLAEAAAGGIPMYALSNYSPWWSLIEDKLRLSRYVRWDFVSCDTGLRKPDPRAYLHAYETLKVDPSRCVFIDDRADNVDAAKNVGMQGIFRTESIDDLRRSLADLAIVG